MRIRIINIDFAKSAVAIEVTPKHTEASRVHLRTFVSKCRALGIKNIVLYYGPDTPKWAASLLKQFCSSENLPAPGPAPPGFNADQSYQSGLLAGAHLSTPKSRLSEYEVSFRNLDTVINDLTTTVMLISDVADLDPRSQFKLRLSLYELVVNTVEHGTFCADTPEIAIRLTFAEERVSVSYADNATVFMADGVSAVDMVEEQIRSNSKRGLGLYLLNNVCEQWKYIRSENWNLTTFILEISRYTTTQTQR